jgi:hypothetical protein
VYELRPQSPSASSGSGASAAPPPSPREKVRTFVDKHGRKLWWLHSAYALVLGACVVAFAQKGFLHAPKTSA